MNLTRKSGLGIKPSGFLILLVGAVACGAIWVVGLSPLQSRVDETAQQVATANAQVVQTRQLLDQAEAGGPAYLSQLEQAALYADELLPSNFDPVELLTIIPPSAASFGVTAVLSQDNPDAAGLQGAASAAAEAPSGTIQKVATRVEALGPITSILEWVDSLRTVAPIVTIDSVSIAGIDGETTATVQLSVWYTTEPSLVPAAPQGGGDTTITPLPSGSPTVVPGNDTTVAPSPQPAP